MSDFDISAAQILDAPPPDPIVPNHKASRDGNNRGPAGFFRNHKGPGANERPQRTQRQPKAKTIPGYKPGQYIDAIEGFYTMLAMTAMPFDEHCASVFMEVPYPDDNPLYAEHKHAGKTRARICAEAIDAAAEKSIPLRRILDMLTTGGTWGMVISAHAPIIFAILSHHTPLIDKGKQAVMDRMAQRVKHMQESEMDGALA